MTPRELAVAIYSAIAKIETDIIYEPFDEVEVDDQIVLIKASEELLKFYTVTPIDPTKGCSFNNTKELETCEIDNGNPHDCDYACELINEGSGRDDCQYWKTPTSAVKP